MQYVHGFTRVLIHYKTMFLGVISHPTLTCLTPSSTSGVTVLLNPRQQSFYLSIPYTVRLTV